MIPADIEEDTKARNASSLPSRLIPKHLQKKRLPFSAQPQLFVSTTGLANPEPEQHSQHVSFCPPYTPMLSESPTQTMSSNTSSKRASFDANSRKTSTASTNSTNKNRFLFFFHYPPTTPGSAASSSSSHSSNSAYLSEILQKRRLKNENQTPFSAPIECFEPIQNNRTIASATVSDKSITLNNSLTETANNPTSVFSSRKSSIAKICSTFRRSSVAAINISSFARSRTDDASLERPIQRSKMENQQFFSGLATPPRKVKKTSLVDLTTNSASSPQRKTSNASSASRAVKKKISAAKFAFRKMSQSSISGLSYLKNTVNETKSQGDSPELDRRFQNTEILNRNGSLSSLVKRSYKESVKKKKSLGPSLSWDIDRSPSPNSPSRIHSDDNGRKSAKNSLSQISSETETKKSRLNKTRKSSNQCLREIYSDRLELENSCLHCQMGIIHRRKVLQAKLEQAANLHSRRLEPNRPLGNTGSTGSWPRVDEKSTTITASEANIHNAPGITRDDSQNRRSMGTPDIVVSSISSDDEYTESVFVEATEQPNEVTVSTTFIRPPPLSVITTNLTHSPSFLMNSEISSTSSSSPSPMYNNQATTPLPTNEAPAFVAFEMSSVTPTNNYSNNFFPPPLKVDDQKGIMDSLKPPNYVNTTQNVGDNNLLTAGSPPRSNSVDLSTLRRELELWSISSAENSDIGSDTDYDGSHTNNPNSSQTNAEKSAEIADSNNSGPSRTVRSKSHDPSQSPEHFLRRHSRIEHLSELFRKALAKSPVVKRAAAIQEQEQRRISKHRTTRYWLDDQVNIYMLKSLLIS